MIKPYRSIYPKIHPSAFIEESAHVIGDVVIGEASSVWFGVVIRGDVNYIRIGSRTNIQDGSVLHVVRDVWSLVIEDEVTVGHGCRIHGCHIKSQVLIGIGATVLDGAVVEQDSIVGAGTLVPPGFRVLSGTLVMGVPAKVKRKLKPEEINSIKQSASNYVEYMKSYKS